MYIVFDIGGTTTRIGVSGNFRKLDRTDEFVTSADFKEAVNHMVEAAEKLMAGKRPRAASVAVAGVLNEKKTEIAAGTNLQDWVNKPLAKILARKLKTKVFLANDADIAGLGEAVMGAGKGKKIVAYFTIGTGVGGARIVDGKLDVSSQGFEPGYQIIVPGGRAISIGQKGCLEAYVSGAAFVRHPLSWQKYSQILGQGVVNAIVFWSPDVVVIGGGFAIDKGKYFIKPLKDFVSKNLSFFRPVPVRIAKLGKKSALYGGLQYLKSEL